MKTKWPIYTGLLLILSGIITKVSGGSLALVIILLVFGGGFKLFYLFQRIKSKSYQPGIELIILLLGLLLFFFGMYFCSKPNIAPFFIGSGIFLKTSFIILFIRKIK